MNKDGTVLIIDDDAEDLLFLEEILSSIIEENGFKNDIITYSDPVAAYEYLMDMNDAPFLIISDINMPKIDGIALRKKIIQESRQNISCSPFIFLSTAAGDQNIIERAYNLSIQGFFTKSNNFEEYNALLERIIFYWKASNLPPQRYFYSQNSA